MQSARNSIDVYTKVAAEKYMGKHLELKRRKEGPYPGKTIEQKVLPDREFRKCFVLFFPFSSLFLSSFFFRFPKMLFHAKSVYSTLEAKATLTSGYPQAPERRDILKVYPLRDGCCTLFSPYKIARVIYSLRYRYVVHIGYTLLGLVREKKRRMYLRRPLSMYYLSFHLTLSLSLLNLTNAPLLCNKRKITPRKRIKKRSNRQFILKFYLFSVLLLCW